jgi:hypothetical protein
MTRLRILALLCLAGCGRSGAITEGDLAKLRPGCTIHDVIKAFGPGQPTELNVIIYPDWDSERQYLVLFDGQSGRVLEIVRVDQPNNTSVRVWPPGAPPGGEDGGTGP